MEYEVYSHHPHITAYLLEDVDGDYKFWWASEFTARLGTNSMKAGQGHGCIKVQKLILN